MLTQLRCLQLNNNQFTGDISDARVEFNTSLSTLDIGHNNLSGRIPTYISTLSILILQNNSFHGPIQLDICQMYMLAHLDLSKNQLSGHIPSCLLGLHYLHLQHNKLTGPIPNAHNYPPTLDLSHNNLSGSIPTTNGFSEGMMIFLVSGNRLSGLIPNSLCWLKNVHLMDLSHNMLSGSIPSCFSNITMFGKIINTQELYLSQNLPVFYNATTGGIDPEFSTVPMDEQFVTKSRLESYQDDIFSIMGGLDLSSNELSGEIPQDISALVGIRTLNFSHNQLAGLIPNHLSRMKQIESLDFSHNKLTGEIPSDLNAITTLAVFTVAYNNLSGWVPDMKAQFATFNEACYEGNPLLCGLPLPKQCDNNTSTPTTVTVAKPDGELWMDLISFLTSFGYTYILCLLAIVTALYINPHWRRIWFDFADSCLSFVVPFWSEAIYNTRNPFT